MDTRGSSEMLVTLYVTTQYQTQTDHSFDICHYENLKSKVNETFSQLGTNPLQNYFTCNTLVTLNFKNMSSAMRFS